MSETKGITSKDVSKMEFRLRLRNLGPDDIAMYPIDLTENECRQIVDEERAMRAMAAPAETKCCVCGKAGLSTVEGDGGTECELADGRWTCSFECWERAVEPDPVNSPSHYVTGGIECFDAMQAMLTREEMIGYLRGNSFKYRWRFRHKGGAEDLRKAEWYEKKLLELVDNSA